MPRPLGDIYPGSALDRVADLIERHEGQWLNVNQVIGLYRSHFDERATEDTIRHGFYRLRGHPRVDWEWEKRGWTVHYGSTWHVRCPE